MRDSFQNYLNQIGRHPLLTSAQEIELSRQYRTGEELRMSLGARKPTARERGIIRAGERAKRKMIVCNLRLVVSIAKNYVGGCHTHQLEDLVQAGSIGLSRAAEKFDHERGYKFSTYAYWWIKQSITREISKCDNAIRIPDNLQTKWSGFKKKVQNLSAELGRAPTEQEILGRTGIDWKLYKTLLLSTQAQISLHTKVFADGDGTRELIDAIADESHGPSVATDYNSLFAAIELLPERERDIIRKRYGFGDNAPHTLEEISRDHGVTRERIRQRILEIQTSLRLKMARMSA